MLGLIILAAAATTQVDTCAAAVHGDLAAAAKACDVPPGSIDLMSPNALTGACLDAMDAGKTASMYSGGTLPVVRDSMIREFDKKLDLCRKPKDKPVPARETVHLWD